jgi:hypothetical protein
MKLRSDPTPRRVLERARDRWDDGSHGCRISTYSVGSHGYAQLGWYADRTNHMVLAHRGAWEAERGPIPEGMTDHMCKQRRCVNVLHLRLLTNHENARRNTGRDMPLGRCRPRARRQRAAALLARRRPEVARLLGLAIRVAARVPRAEGSRVTLTQGNDLGPYHFGDPKPTPNTTGSTGVPVPCTRSAQAGERQEKAGCVADR